MKEKEKEKDKTIKIKQSVYDKIKNISEELSMPMSQVINYLCIEYRKNNG